MEPYIPDTLPLDSIDWAAHVSLIGQANAALARYDGMLQGIVNPAVISVAPHHPGSRAVVQNRRNPGQHGGSAGIRGRPPGRGGALQVRRYSGDHQLPAGHGPGGGEPGKAPPLPEPDQGVPRRPAGQRARPEQGPGPVSPHPELHRPPRIPIERLLLCLRRRIGCSRRWTTGKNICISTRKTVWCNWRWSRPSLKSSIRFWTVTADWAGCWCPFSCSIRNCCPARCFTSAPISRPTGKLISRVCRAISQKHDWNGWIQFFLTAVVEQAADNIDKVREMLRLYGSMKSRMVEITHSQFAIQALDAIFSRPIFRGADFLDDFRHPNQADRRLTGAPAAREPGFSKSCNRPRDAARRCW